MLPNFTG